MLCLRYEYGAVPLYPPVCLVFRFVFHVSVLVAHVVQKKSLSLTTSHQSSTPIAMIHGPLFQRNASTPILSVASLCNWLHQSRNCNRSQRLTSKWNGRLLVMSADWAVPMYCWDRRAPAVGPNRSLSSLANSSSPLLPFFLELHGIIVVISVADECSEIAQHNSHVFCSIAAA